MMQTLSLSKMKHPIIFKWQVSILKHPESMKMFTVLTRTIIRSSSSAATAAATAANAKNNYYQKLEPKPDDKDERVKPQGWDEAKPFEEIPRLQPLPIIGNTWRFFPGSELYKVEYIELFKKLHQKFGKITILSGLIGMQPFVVCFDPNDFEQVLRNEGPWPNRKDIECVSYYRKHVRPEVFKGAEGIATLRGKEWFQQRSVVNKILMQPRTIEMYVSAMDEVANGLLELIRHLARMDPKSEMPPDFQNELYKWTLESVGVVAYNRRIGCLEPNLKQDSDGQKFINAVQEMFDLMYQLDFRPSMWKIVSTPKWRKFVRIMDYITEVNQRYVSECLASVDPNLNIPDHERSALERLAKVDEKIAASTASDMLIAGVDTTGKSVASTLYFVAKNPQIQEKLRQELKSVLPHKNSPVTKETLSQIPYLRAVIKETFRLAPVAVGNSRITVKDTVVGDYRIPKGTEIVLSNAIACWSDKYFRQPDQFIPERWLRDDSTDLSCKNTHPFVYLPFGFGPRSCVGKRLANLEAEVGLAKVIRNFKLSWNYPDATFTSRLLYGITSPLKIKMEEVEF